MDWNTLKTTIPIDGLVEKYEIYRRARPTLTLVVLRTVTEPTLFRNTDPERAETIKLNGNLHAQVNGEKFVSKERLTGLNLCRELDKDGDIISPEYTYNEPTSLPKSQTSDMLTYGLAGTVTGKTFSQKSRVIEGYTYGLESYDIMNKETHNALYESGTMTDEERVQSESLFNPVKVQPGTHFVHFITLEAGTKEMLLYVAYNILNTGRYGARETRTGRNIKNELVGLITSSCDSCLSSGELLRDYLKEIKTEYDRDDISSMISKYIANHKKTDWMIYHSSDFNLGGQEFPDWFKNVLGIAMRTKKEDLAILREALVTLRKNGIDEVTDKKAKQTNELENESDTDADK